MPYPRLLHLKGTKNAVRVDLVSLSASSLNSGDVFILDTEFVVYQWVGKKSNIYERAAALELTIKIKNQEKRPWSAVFMVRHFLIPAPAIKLLNGIDVSGITGGSRGT